MLSLSELLVAVWSLVAGGFSAYFAASVWQSIPANVTGMRSWLKQRAVKHRYRILAQAFSQLSWRLHDLLEAMDDESCLDEQQFAHYAQPYILSSLLCYPSLQLAEQPIYRSRTLYVRFIHPYGCLNIQYTRRVSPNVHGRFCSDLTLDLDFLA